MRHRHETSAAAATATTSTTILALATLIGLLIGLATLSMVAGRSNEAEASAERDRVTAAVQVVRAATARDTARLAVLPVAGILTGDLGSLDQVLLVGRTSPGDVEFLAGTRFDGIDLAPRAARLARRVTTESEGRAADMIEVGGDIFDAVALPRADGTERPGPPAVLVGLRRVDAVFLADLARIAGVRTLQLARAAAGTPQAANGAVGWGGVGLTWDPARPGDVLVVRWTIALVVATTAIAILIILTARRAAAALHASEARAVEASRNDWLSGLPNRAYFNLLLERDLATLADRSGKLALFLLDIDGFRELNGAFGMEAGDTIIQGLTTRIAAVLEPGQSMARFEGDAFVILQPEIGSPAECERLAETVLNAVKAPFALGGSSVPITVSIGVALAPDDATERCELVRLAGMALRRAKHEGGNRLCFYEPALQDEWRRRTAVERELRDAIAAGDLVLHYQPIVDAATDEVVCVEALVRWHHRTEGLIPPDRFIGLAENRGLILPLGEWVMREACLAAAAWPGARVAVNVSPVQFRQRDFVGVVDRILAEIGLDPARLELEITEGVLLTHEAEAVAAMAALRARGIRLALDDFGAGYSSLMYLRRFAIDKIKIDKAFIDALEPESESAVLVESVVKLGRALGLTVTAEGVETADQRRLLQALGCHQLQGYLISPPLTASEFGRFLAGHREGPPRAVA